MTDRGATFADRPAGELQNGRAFDLWAPSYDTQQNPLLVLEQRYLERMLPDLSGRDVLDAGCGSGRWLTRLSGAGVRTLCGVDASGGMLRAAALKNLAGTELSQCDCDETPYVDQCFDLILSSFVLSYLGNLESFAAEMDRIARPGCDLFLSDMHPATESQLGWKRTFQNGYEAIALETVGQSIRDVIGIFVSLGWKLCAALEPEFGTPEREVFEAAGRMNRFNEAGGLPAIYLLHLQKPSGWHTEIEDHNQITIGGSRCAIGSRETVAASLQIDKGRIRQTVSEGLAISGSPSLVIDLSGYLVMPGLINAHDHLEFSLFPRLANPPYTNASFWATDIHGKFPDLIAKHRSVPKRTRLWWGALRNLLSGVTSVCHHNPQEPEFERDDFPVRVVSEFGWAHSLKFAADLRRSHSATPVGSPYVVHACEGIDEEARQEIWELDRLGVLDRDSVVIHGLAMDEDGLALMRRAGASLVICPSSNDFLFGATPDMHLIRGVPQIALGSDSPLTATGDLLDEVQFAVTSCDVPPHLAYSMVTEFPASILHLKNGEGSLRVSAVADLIAVRDTGQAPADRLRTLSFADIEFSMIGGRVRLASDSLLERLPQSAREGLQPVSVDGVIRWLRAPVVELLLSAEEILGTGQVRLGGKSISLPVGSEARHAR